MITIRVKDSNKVIAQNFDSYPSLDTVLQTYLLLFGELRYNLQITIQTNNAQQRSQRRQRTVKIGDYQFRFDKHVIRVWDNDHSTDNAHTLAHELGHAYWKEYDRENNTEKHTNEALADEIAGKILYDGILPDVVKTWSGMTSAEITKRLTHEAKNDKRRNRIRSQIREFKP